MEDQSYIKLFRSVLDWDWWDDVSVKLLWITILLSANWKDKKWRGIVIKKGSFFTSLDHLSKKAGLSVRQTRTALEKLKSTGEVTIETTSHGTLITVENWEKFQGYEPNATSESTSGLTSERQATDKRATNERQQLKKDKNNKKDKKDIYSSLRSEYISKESAEELEKALSDFEQMRKSIKKPMTDGARNLLVNNLKKLAGDDTGKMVAILEQSILNSWAGVYELKGSGNVRKNLQRNDVGGTDGSSRGMAGPAKSGKGSPGGGGTRFPSVAYGIPGED